MASLIEELIQVLNEECDIYERLLEISGNKTQVIVAGNLAALQTITEIEQDMVTAINGIEKKRETAVSDIAMVLNRNAASLNIAAIIQLLQQQVKEHDALAEVHLRLKRVLERLKDVNAHNKILIDQSLELVNFNMTLVQNARMAPETANYDRKSYSGSYMANSMSMFDTKQ